MHLIDHITLDRVHPDMEAASKDQALEELSRLLTGGDPDLAGEVLQVLQERESLASTGIGEHIAIPHGKLNAMEELVMGLGRSRTGLDFDSVDGKPTYLFFILVAPENSTGIHLKALARISKLCRDTTFRQRLVQAKTRQEMFELLQQEDRKFWTQ